VTGFGDGNYDLPSSIHPLHPPKTKFDSKTWSAMNLSKKSIRRARLSYRAHLADRVDLLMAAGDDHDFQEAWSAVSPALTQNHRPSARRLWQLAKLPNPGTIVEIGSFMGNSTIYLAMAAGESAGAVHAVDPHTPASMRQTSIPVGPIGCRAAREPEIEQEPEAGREPEIEQEPEAGREPEIEQEPEAGRDTVCDRPRDAMEVSDLFLANLERFGVRERVSYHRASSVDAARSWSGEPVRLLFVDGMHTYEAVRQDYMAWQPFLAERHAVLFDDYLWAEVQHAVDDLRALIAPSCFYVRGGQAIFSTTPLALRVVGLP
jgi:hypothetical protein